MALSTIKQQYFSSIVAVIFTGEGNRSTQRKPQACRKSLTLSHNVVSSTPPQNLTKRCIHYEKPSAEEFDPANPFSPVYQVLAGDMSKKKYMPV
jgi:hypothetical protein